MDSDSRVFITANAFIRGGYKPHGITLIYQLFLFADNFHNYADHNLYCTNSQRNENHILTKTMSIGIGAYNGKNSEEHSQKQKIVQIDTITLRTIRKARFLMFLGIIQVIN